MIKEMCLLSKTIKQIADELGISKTAIRKYMTPEFREKYVQTSENGLLFINEAGENFLQSLRKQPQTSQTKFAETSGNLVSTEFITVLQEQLRVKDEQIRYLSIQIEQLQAALAAEQQKNSEQVAKLTTALENTTASLNASQALHATDRQQLLLMQKSNEEAPKHWWQRNKKNN